MSLKLNNISPVTSEVWSSIWSSCDWSTYSESPQWSKLWNETFGDTHVPAPHLVQYSDGMQLLLPVTRVVRAGKWFEVQLMGPSGGYGGPLASTIPTSAHINLLLEEIPRKFPDYHLRLNPFMLRLMDQHEHNDDLAATMLLKPIKQDFTQPVPLNASTEHLLSKKRARRYANAASKKGFYVKEMHAREIQDYLNVYKQARERWSDTTVSYRDELFHNMAKLRGCTFFGVYDADNTFCGGGPFLFSKNVVTTWLSFMANMYLQDHIYELFYYTLILKFRDDGYQWFDFNPSGGQDGVVRFKQKFTPHRLSAPLYENYSWKRLFMMTLGRA